MNIDLNLIVESIPEMLSGFGTTLYLLLFSGFLGLLLAIVLLLMRISGKFYLDFPAQIYIYIFNSFTSVWIGANVTLIGSSNSTLPLLILRKSKL